MGKIAPVPAVDTVSSGRTADEHLLQREREEQSFRSGSDARRRQKLLDQMVEENGLEWTPDADSEAVFKEAAKKYK